MKSKTVLINKKKQYLINYEQNKRTIASDGKLSNQDKYEYYRNGNYGNLFKTVNSLIKCVWCAYHK